MNADDFIPVSPENAPAAGASSGTSLLATAFTAPDLFPEAPLLPPRVCATFPLLVSESTDVFTDEKADIVAKIRDMRSFQSLGGACLATKEL